MDKRRRSIVGGLGLAVVGAAMGHASAGPLAQGAQAPLSPLVIAPTGRGKGVGVGFPNLLTFKGPVEVDDVKGENLIVPIRRPEGPSDD